MWRRAGPDRTGPAALPNSRTGPNQQPADRGPSSAVAVY